MKKVVVTRENYEEVMFNLLENEYETPVREDILAQIDADTFLSFEWKQWSKASYSESLEPYKSQEAEFIESLVKKENRGFILPLYKKMSWAAAVALILGVGIVTYKYASTTSDVTVAGNDKTEQIKAGQKDQETEGLIPKAHAPETVVSSHGTLNTVRKNKSREEINLPLLPTDAVEDSSVAMVVKFEEKPASFEDTVKMMIANATKAQKKSKYKVSITEGTMDGSVHQHYAFNERRYTMADVMVHKDGITLSKFLNNSTSRIIKTDNSTYIEYIAEDQSILILTLAQ